MLALFPAMLVLVSILGLLGKSTTQQVLTNLGQVAPGGVNSFLKGVVTQVQGKAGVAGVAGIIGIVIALWSASGYVAAFMRAMNAIYDVDEGRPIWKTAPIRAATTVALVVMLVIAAAIVVLTGPIAKQVGTAFGIGHTAVLIWDIVKWPVLLVIVSVMISLLYKASPNVRQPAFRWISAGGVVAVILWLIASGLFTVYVSFSGSYNKTYGSLATVIVFLVWLWISNIAILLGRSSTPKPSANAPSAPGCPKTSSPSPSCVTPANSTTRRNTASRSRAHPGPDHEHRTLTGERDEQEIAESGRGPPHGSRAGGQEEGPPVGPAGSPPPARRG